MINDPDCAETSSGQCDFGCVRLKFRCAILFETCTRVFNVKNCQYATNTSCVGIIQLFKVCKIIDKNVLACALAILCSLVNDRSARVHSM